MQRVTINLAPADLPKEGPAYDLPIALGMLALSRGLPTPPPPSFDAPPPPACRR